MGLHQPDGGMERTGLILPLPIASLPKFSWIMHVVCSDEPYIEDPQRGDLQEESSRRDAGWQERAARRALGGKNLPKIVLQHVSLSLTRSQTPRLLKGFLKCRVFIQGPPSRHVGEGQEIQQSMPALLHAGMGCPNLFQLLFSPIYGIFFFTRTKGSVLTIGVENSAWAGDVPSWLKRLEGTILHL